MYTHTTLAELQTRSLRLQSNIRRQMFTPAMVKTLRRFSPWEVSELILGVDAATFREALASRPDLPRGEAEAEGRQPWFSMAEIDTLRRALAPDVRTSDGRALMPVRPQGTRALRTAVANFKGGAGKSTVALHLAHAAALDGYRVLCVDFDPQATLSHAMGLVEVAEERTVWGIIVRDLMRETARMNAAPRGAASGAALPHRTLPASITGLGIGDLSTADFIRPTAWPNIDIVPSCANAAFVEFASAQYRHLVPEWTFFAAVARYLAEIADDAYDLIFFDCPPAIGYQSMNAVFAADMLYVPSGPGYWEYDSTTSFIGQLSEALADLAEGYGASWAETETHLGAGTGAGLGTADGKTFPAGKVSLPKSYLDIRFLMTRFEPGNDLHRAMYEAYGKVFGAHLCEHTVEMTRAVEQSGRFLASVYEIDYRDMNRETWRRARTSFDRVWAEFRDTALAAWPNLTPPPSTPPAPDAATQDAAHA